MPVGPTPSQPVPRSFSGLRDYLSGVIRHQMTRIFRAGTRAGSSIATVAILACAAAVPKTAAVAQAEPLTAFAAQRVAVMPIQTLRSDSTLPVKASDWAAVRKEFDDSVAAAIAERGIGKTWTYAPDIARMAKRNMGYASDPYALGVTGLRNRQLKIDDPVPPIVVSNLRSLIALGDARYALVPVELAFVRKGTEVRPVVRLAMIDGRMGRISWYGDLVGAPSATFTSADIGAFAQRVADIVAPR